MELIAEFLTNPISGSNLNLLFENSIYIDSLFYQKVIDGPSKSLENIEKYYKCNPSIDGGNISGISLIRDILFSIIKEKKILNSFVITAPHTHWPYKKPVIYLYDKKLSQYIIGPHKIDISTEYIPVSFVFFNNTPLPYEWVDESVYINRKEWLICHDIISILNEKIQDKNIPLGIAIDFRFRSSLFDENQPSLELPTEDNNKQYKNFSYIINSSSFIENEIQEATEQVSWHSISDRMYDFTECEQILISQLRQILDSVDSMTEKEDLIREIHKSLGK